MALRRVVALAPSQVEARPVLASAVVAAPAAVAPALATAPHLEITAPEAVTPGPDVPTVRSKPIGSKLLALADVPSFPAPTWKAPADPALAPPLLSDLDRKAAARESVARMGASLRHDARAMKGPQPLVWKVAAGTL